ncbi:MAG TPA: hypothetical protein VGE04_04960, partial [Chloroflexia bacterium]
MQQPPEYPPQPLAQGPQLAGDVMDQGTERLLAGVAHGAIAFGLFGLTLPISLLINVVVVIILGLYGGFAVFRAVRGETAWSDLGPVLWGIGLFALWFV